jgi:catechol 2,3-dioxygenase-like lactoylglutathione lyase family enzyme
MPSDAPVFAQVNLVVADMAAAVAFYRRLGLAIDDSRPFSAHHIDVPMPGGVVLELDSVAFAKRWDAGWRGGTGGGRAVVGFNLTSREAVDARWADLVGAGYAGRQAPHDAFWGARHAIVEDPDGNPVGLMSPIDPARRGVPPAL